VQTYERPLLFGPCAKRRTQAVLTTVTGEKFVGENVCLNPQPVCPREEGEGYEKCKSICQQLGHAEEQAIQAAGDKARGSTIDVTHWYACKPCSRIALEAGVKNITCVAPEDSVRTPNH
jgi:deoxycytidylate deaminase